MTDHAFGLGALRSEASCLIPDDDRGQWPAADQALTIRVRREPGYAIVTVAGEVDYAAASQLRARLSALAAEGRPLVADLDQVGFIDAAGLGVLAGTARQAACHGASLHVVCARHRTRRLFRIAGLDLPLAGTLAEALRALAASPPAVASGVS